jgi:hypothetical protein
LYFKGCQVGVGDRFGILVLFGDHMSSGFDGRRYLFDYEHQTYLRRMPVRFVKHAKDSVCWVCGGPATPDNPFENAHRIPFGVGVRRYKLTPEFLDSKENIVTAHKRGCNKRAELSDSDIQELLSR